MKEIEMKGSGVFLLDMPIKESLIVKKIREKLFGKKKKKVEK